MPTYFKYTHMAVLFKGVNTVEKKYDYKKAKMDWHELNVSNEADIPLYMKDWYWDAVCDSTDEWKVICIYSEEGEIEAAFPFLYTKRKGLWFIELPWQVSYAGIWLRNKDISNKEKALKYLNENVKAIVESLPYYDYFHVTFGDSLWTWHPFYWLGYDARPTYTSIICADRSDIKKSVTYGRRKNINRAEKKYKILIDNISVEQYWNLFEQSYDTRGKKISHVKNKFINFVEILKQHDSCEIRTAIDENENIVAINIFLIDSKKYYHQFGTQLAGCKDATSFIIYNGIKACIDNKRNFDFEGSMIQGVCEFNVSWNPEFETHYVITKSSRKYRILNLIRQIFRDKRNS